MCGNVLVFSPVPHYNDGCKKYPFGGTLTHEKLNTRQIALNGIVAGLYAAITILTASFAYGNIQFRISEALMMLLLLGAV